MSHLLRPGQPGEPRQEDNGRKACNHQHKEPQSEPAIVGGALACPEARGGYGGYERQDYYAEEAYVEYRAEQDQAKSRIREKDHGQDRGDRLRHSNDTQAPSASVVGGQPVAGPACRERRKDSAHAQRQREDHVLDDHEAKRQDKEYSDGSAEQGCQRRTGPKGRAVGCDAVARRSSLTVYVAWCVHVSSPYLITSKICASST